MFITPDSVRKPLHVITPIFNPVRYKARWKLYERFAKMVADAGATLHTVEVAFGDREHALDDTELRVDQTPGERNDVLAGSARKARPGHEYSAVEHSYLKLRTQHELWLKENAINLALARLPEDWEYVAWIDADVAFARPNWVGETLHQLQHYHVVQMFSEAVDLSPQHEIIGPRHKGFMWCYETGQPRRPTNWDYYGSGPQQPGQAVNLWHPGFAWAARRDAINTLGGLFDVGILGAGDNHMANALIGDVGRSVHPDMHERYKEALEDWQGRAEHGIRRNVGHVAGLLLHYWHGKKADRRYKDRWEILVQDQFNPASDIKRDFQGLYQLRDHSGAEPRLIHLRDEIRRYFRGRNEDSIDV